MNEIQLLRVQLATERLHVGAVATACAAAWSGAADLRAAGHDYLLCVLGWFDERDRRLREFVRTHPDVRGHERQGFEDALGQPGGSDEALEKLKAAQGGASLAWQALAQFVGTVWERRRGAIDALLATITRPADWRAIARLDADSILEERRRFERVNAACPPGALLTEDVAARNQAQC
ncbi:MAG TPA: hypothetical protein VK676_14895 [Steroidobacteraceae bacterium]|nr:hypothetical protein [Steroidobacteraceae bacterium]